MDNAIAVAIIEILPSILAFVTLFIVIIVFRKPLEQRILPRLSGLKVFGVELTLLQESLNEAATVQNVTISADDKLNALKRAQHVLPVLQGARLLWADDTPELNLQIIKIIESLGIVIDKARDTDEALKLLRRHKYDVVVSDIKRNGENDAGIKMVAKMWEEHIYRWTIFYVLHLRLGLPEHAFNITNRPDHLLHFIMDVLERERWSNYSAQ